VRPEIALINRVFGTSGKAACPLRTSPVAVDPCLQSLANAAYLGRLLYS
jgi:hypothetical protein